MVVWRCGFGRFRECALELLVMLLRACLVAILVLLGICGGGGSVLWLLVWRRAFWWLEPGRTSEESGSREPSDVLD